MRLIVALAFLILAVILAVQNSVVVTVMLLLWRVQASLAIVIFLCFGLGAVAGALTFTPSWYRKRSLIKKLQQRVAQLEAESGQRVS